MIFAHRWALLAAPLVIGAGCGGAIEDGRDPRFVGTWKLQTGSGNMSSETWELRADGRSVMLGRNSDKPIIVTQRDSIGCAFGDQWNSLDSAHLLIALQCSDNVARTGTVAFPVDATTNASGTVIEVVAVDGARDWERGGLTMTMYRLN